MDSSPQIQRAYRDDVHAGVATPLLPVKEDLLTAQPRWSKKSNRRRNFVCAAIVMSTILAIYLLLCAAFIIGNDMSFRMRLRLPWPFPGRRPHPHPPPRLHPIVLGCTAIPTAEPVQIELNVTLPRHAVVLGSRLLHGDISIKKVNQSHTETTNEGTNVSTNRTMLVAINVANRTWGPHPTPKGEPDDAENASKSFSLCAITFPRHPPPHHPPPIGMEMEGQVELASEEHPPPHKKYPFRHHPPPPVIVGIFPALNKTHPKLSETLEELEMAPFDETSSTDSVFLNAWKAAISFLSPILNVFPTDSEHPGHHPCHRRPFRRPPFVVTDLHVIVPKCTRVIFGHGLPHRRWKH